MFFGLFSFGRVLGVGLGFIMEGAFFLVFVVFIVGVLSFFSLVGVITEVLDS